MFLSQPAPASRRLGGVSLSRAALGQLFSPSGSLSSNDHVNSSLPDTLTVSDSEDTTERLHSLPKLDELVSCGGHSASHCSECPLGGHGESWCNGDCSWNHTSSVCSRSPWSVHPVYRQLVQRRPFQPVVDEEGKYVNVILVRSPFETVEQEDLYEMYKNDILFLGIMSNEAYPLRSPNPWSFEFAPEEYVSRFPGWLNMYRNPEAILSEELPVTQISHSDFSVLEIDFDAEVQAGVHDKIYDFIYVMTNTENEVKKGCTGWGAFAKNWVSRSSIMVSTLQTRPYLSRISPSPSLRS